MGMSQGDGSRELVGLNHWREMVDQNPLIWAMELMPALISAGRADESVPDLVVDREGISGLEAGSGSS